MILVVIQRLSLRWNAVDARLREYFARLSFCAWYKGLAVHDSTLVAFRLRLCPVLGELHLESHEELCSWRVWLSSTRSRRLVAGPVAASSLPWSRRALFAFSVATLVFVHLPTARCFHFARRSHDPGSDHPSGVCGRCRRSCGRGMVAMAI